MTTRSCVPQVTVVVLLLSRFDFSSGEWPTPMREGNPIFGSRLQLINDIGFYLAILPNTRIKGTQEDSDVYTFLDVQTAGPGKVKLRGIETGFYLAMDERGFLYGSDNPGEGATVFNEMTFGQYNLYESNDHPGWFVGINNKGAAKPGPHTKYGHKSTKFLPIRGY